MREPVRDYVRRIINHYDFEDPAQMALAVENGEIDIAWRILGLTEAFRLGDVEGLTAFNSGGVGIRYLVPNHQMAPFDDQNVRQAISYLVDRDEIIDRALQVHGALGYSTDSPLSAMATQARWARFADGADEIHQWRIAQRAIDAYTKTGSVSAAAGDMPL